MATGSVRTRIIRRVAILACLFFLSGFPWVGLLVMARWRNGVLPQYKHLHPEPSPLWKARIAAHLYLGPLLGCHHDASRSELLFAVVQSFLLAISVGLALTFCRRSWPLWLFALITALWTFMGAAYIAAGL